MLGFALRVHVKLVGKIKRNVKIKNGIAHGLHGCYGLTQIFAESSVLIGV